ncbi:MAG: GNAT family N-acetyltransferase [Hyphomicrobiales bacterium]|nr:GNAT family N-acetyltransferase [Hyphomicrobiales bacterium]MDE2113512.1 GNAT family N-acetyltransferase [Hyphomicrobiales bacterium]
MALFGITSPLSSSPILRGEDIYMRLPEMRDFEAWVDLREKSQAFLAQWEPIWPDDDFTRTSFRRRVRRHIIEAENEESLAFLIFRRTDNQLVGGVTLGHIRRGVAQAATLGYWMGAPYAGQHYMSRAVRALTQYSFGQLRLHRLEAACLPRNNASINLLKATGFSQEGLARSYLRIAGQWQDHLLFARLENDPLPKSAP